MTAATDRTLALTTSDGVPLKISLRRAERRAMVHSLLLVAPLLAFIVASFAIPIAVMLYRSIDNPEVADTLPRVTAALQGWDGKALPGEPIFAAMAEDLRQAQKDRTVGLV